METGNSMAKPPKGGRGKSQYLSTHVRMPDPLVQQCLKMREQYWEYIENGGDPANPPNYLLEKSQIQEPPEPPHLLIFMIYLSLIA